MKLTYLTSLVVLMVACSGGKTSGGDTGENQTELKRAAANARGQQEPGDVCGDRDWYGDGVCDSFCEDFDVDCTPDDDGVMCAEFVEDPNGYCSRKDGDPCMSQDPDCAGDSVEPQPVEPPDSIICTAIAQLPDGVCKPDPNDPCVLYQDPDCHPNSGGSNGYPGDDPSDPNTGTTCQAAPEPADGICQRQRDAACQHDDPDCVPDVACAEYLEQPDGICKREPSDPCIFQDPDCAQ